MLFSNRPFGELFAEPTRNGLTRPKAVRGAGTKMVNMGELFANSRIANIPMDRVPLTQSEAERSLLKVGDLLFARQSLVLEGAGKCSIFLGDQEPVTFESHVTRVRLNPEEADPRFYFYWLQSFSGRNAIRSIVEQGAGAAGIRGSDLQNLSVIWCPVEVQRQIAEILSVLDDKIELNRRMNETLEAMARAIFQSWFVDFDPVRAKASGESADSICQRLGLTPQLLALFPDSFEDSELGEIPKGWLPTRLDEVLELAYGKALKATDRVDGEIPVYGSGGVTGYHNESLIEGPAIIVGRKGTVGSLYWEDRASFPIDTAFYVKPKAQLTYCYYLLQTLGLETMNTDAAVPGLNRNNVYRLLAPLPRKEIRDEFDRLTKSFRNQIHSSSEGVVILSSIRDALLPKFISGELSVSEAIAEVGE